MTGILALAKTAISWSVVAGEVLTVMTAAILSEIIWLAALTPLVTSLPSSYTVIVTGCPSMPVGCRALNFGPVTVSNAFLVAVPKAALAPLTAVMTPSLMGPSGMAGYFDAACVTGELDFDF